MISLNTLPPGTIERDKMYRTKSCHMETLLLAQTSYTHTHTHRIEDHVLSNSQDIFMLNDESREKDQG